VKTFPLIAEKLAEPDLKNALIACWTSSTPPRRRT